MLTNYNGKIELPTDHDGNIAFPTDPAGTLAMSRCRFPLQNMSYVRMSRRNMANGVLEELGRIEITADGYIYFSDGHDTDRVSFLFGSNYTNIRVAFPSYWVWHTRRRFILPVSEHASAGAAQRYVRLAQTRRTQGRGS